MVTLAYFFHFLAIVVSTVATAMGVSRGHAQAAEAAFEALERQPGIRSEIKRATILGLAIIETAAILGILISFLLLFSIPVTDGAALGEIGIALAIGIPGFIIGWSSGGPTAGALGAIARQPFLARRLTNFMLLVLSLLQTPLIFGFIIALLINVQLAKTETIAQGLTLIGTGIAAGLGCVGPVIGSCIFTKSACISAGRNRFAFPKLFTFTFISQALIETPVIFAVVVALFLSNRATTLYQNPLIGIAYLVFGSTIGLGTLGPGISAGQAAAAAAEQIAYNPAAYTILSRASMLAQGLVSTIAVYAFIVALWLCFTPLV